MTRTAKINDKYYDDNIKTESSNNRATNSNSRNKKIKIIANTSMFINNDND